jgi:hypothetical protein
MEAVMPGHGIIDSCIEMLVELLAAYFERWLNGLVYELFFPGELHARKLTLFDATATLAPPNLAVCQFCGLRLGQS